VSAEEEEVFMSWSDWCRLAHAKPAPREILDDADKPPLKDFRAD
jgi:hypothetical protein